MNVTGGQAPVRILVLIGTRPEAIKMLPVVLALRESRWFEPIVVTAGQHRDSWAKTSRETISDPGDSGAAI